MIFTTINNRGQNLTEADILKAALYDKASRTKKDNIDQSKNFVDRWTDLLSNDETFLDAIKDKEYGVFFLQCYMHILRGKENDDSKLVGLLQFFEGGGKKYKYNIHDSSIEWSAVMKDLETIKLAWNHLNNVQNTEFNNWVFILRAFANEIWLYPVLTFIYTRININKQFNATDIKRCCILMQNITRYFYSKGFSRDVEGSSLPDMMFKLTIDAASDKIEPLEISLPSSFEDNIKNKIATARFRKGFCALLEHLAQAEKGKFTDALRIPNIQVEHILPQKWDSNYYDNWDAQTEHGNTLADETLNKLGNLCLLEKPENIIASKDVFSVKKKTYKSSKLILTHHLSNCGIEKWLCENFNNRHDKCVSKIIAFLTNSKPDSEKLLLTNYQDTNN
jgi:hypothetical protein